MPGLEWILLYGVTGAVVGFMAGLLGVGGGGILVPLLVMLFTHQGIGTEQVIHLALGTALTSMIITSTASTRAHAARGAVAWKVVGGMAPGILVGAYVITQFAAHVDARYIALFFALFMALVAAQMFLNWKPRPSQKPITIPGLMIAGFGIGSVSALAAVGGGFLTVVYLTYKNIDIRKAIGSTAAIGLPISIAGAVGYMVSGWSRTADIPGTVGYLYVPAFVMVSLMSSLVAPIGVRYSHGLPEARLKKILALVSLALSIRMLATVAG